ncbi:hypothetical protein RFI_08406, partial [Reticulomyxa filosa]
MENINLMLQMRPKPEAIVEKGVVGFDDLSRMYDVKDESDEDVNMPNISHANNSNGATTNTGSISGSAPANSAMLGRYFANKSTFNPKDTAAKDAFEKEVPWEISLIKSLLFLTIHEALKKSKLQTAHAEQETMVITTDILTSLGRIRDLLDQMGTQAVCICISLLLFLF